MNAPTFPLRLNAREMQARNVIACQGRGLSLALTPALELDVLPLGAADGDVEQGLGPSERWTLEWGGARFELAVPRAALSDWLAVRLCALGYDGPPPALLDDAWRHTALTLAGDWLLEALAQAGRGETRLLPEADADAAPAPHVFAFETRCAMPDGAPPMVLPGRFACDGLGLMLMAGLIGRHGSAAVGPLAGAGAHLPFSAHVMLGTSEVSLAQLRTIARRDVILITRPATDSAGIFYLSLPFEGGEYGLRARVENGALIPLERPMPKMSEPEEPLNAEAEEAPALAFDQLPVRLTFDLGSVELTLAELENLQPGQGIALSHPLGGAVTIRANGACIGRGELIDIDGRAGVSVLELFAPEAPLAARGAAAIEEDGEEA